MASERRSRAVYRGETLITEFDVDELDDLEALLDDFVDLDPGEDLYVSLSNGERLEVRKLREEEG